MNDPVPGQRWRVRDPTRIDGTSRVVVLSVELGQVTYQRLSGNTAYATPVVERLTRFLEHAQREE